MFRIGDRVIVKRQPHNEPINIVGKVVVIRRVFDGRIHIGMDKDYFCELEIDGRVFDWVELSCVEHENVGKSKESLGMFCSRCVRNWDES